jgi:hypothetical protein
VCSHAPNNFLVTEAFKSKEEQLMEIIKQMSDHSNVACVDKRTLILEVKDAVIGKCSTDLIQQFNSGVRLAQRSCEKRHQQTQEGIKSTRSELRGFEVFQGEILAQVNQLEDRVNMADGDIGCIHSDVKGQHSGSPELRQSADIGQLCLRKSKLARNVILLSGKSHIHLYPMSCKCKILCTYPV